MKDYKAIFNTANEIAREHAYESQGEDVMIFPCGFAWVTLKVRKNDRLGKELEELGLMQWDDYRKCYYIWIGEYNQSMFHKEAHAEAMAKILNVRIEPSFSYGSRMD